MIPERLPEPAPKACTQPPYSFWSGEFFQLLSSQKEYEATILQREWKYYYYKE